MTKQTHIYHGDLSTWMPLVSVWRKVSGVWQKDVMPWIKTSGTWKQCMDYGSEVVVEFEGSTQNITYNTTTWDAYRNLEITGRNQGDELTLDFDYSFSITAGSVTGRVFYRINGGSWVSVTGYLTSSTSGNFSITGVDDNDSVDIRLYLYNNVDSECSLSVETTGGRITTGTGTVAVGSEVSWGIAFVP